MPIRDFIPDGEDKTPEEEARTSHGPITWGRIRPDFIPEKDAPVVIDATPEEKLATAREAAEAAAQVDEATKRALAKELLDKFSVSKAIDHIEGLSSVERERFVSVERENRQRVGILKRFNSVPDVSDPVSEAGAPADVVGEDGDADTPAEGEAEAKESAAEAAAADVAVSEASVPSTPRKGKE